jgi:hypothetical protein
MGEGPCNMKTIVGWNANNNAIFLWNDVRYTTITKCKKMHEIMEDFHLEKLFLLVSMRAKKIQWTLFKTKAYHGL